MKPTQEQVPDENERDIRFISYLIYIIFFETLVLGGTGYAVFVLGHSGWWFALAALFSSAAYPPAKWDL